MTNTEKKQPCKRRQRFSKSALSAICLALVLFCGIGGTLAYIVTKTDSIKNIFTAAKVDNTVEESYDGTIKSSITVKNTGDTAVYVRVKLISYRINDDGEAIGGAAVIPEFTLGEDWIKMGECYYYTKPLLNINDSTSDLLGTDIELTTYSDADGGKQVIEVMSEAIQAEPKKAVEDAWGKTVADQLQSVSSTSSLTADESTTSLDADTNITIE